MIWGFFSQEIFAFVSFCFPSIRGANNYCLVLDLLLFCLSYRWYPFRKQFPKLLLKHFAQFDSRFPSQTKIRQLLSNVCVFGGLTLIMQRALAHPNERSKWHDFLVMHLHPLNELQQRINFSRRSIQRAHDSSSNTNFPFFPYGCFALGSEMCILLSGFLRDRAIYNRVFINSKLKFSMIR